jgi:hypothetical protein
VNYKEVDWRLTNYSMVTPDQQWMEQQAGKVTMKDWGLPAHSRYLLHDGDGKFCPVFGRGDPSPQGQALTLPARSPN